jgi:hypothetical protein
MRLALGCRRRLAEGFGLDHELRSGRVVIDGVEPGAKASELWSASQAFTLPSGWFATEAQFLDAQRGFITLSDSSEGNFPGAGAYRLARPQSSTRATAGPRGNPCDSRPAAEKRHRLWRMPNIFIDTGALQLAAVWVSVVAGLAGLAGVSAGLFSVLTGRDHWPGLLRRLRRRIPASVEDQRRNGMALLLNGTAVMIIIMGISIDNFSVHDHSLGEPLNTLRFVMTLIGMAGAIGGVIGAYSVSLTVKYNYGNLLAEAPPAEP